MEKDLAIRNQKVFIRLDNLIEVQNEYNRVRNGSSDSARSLAQSANNMDSHRTMVIRRQALEFVLDTLQLPRQGN